MGQAGGALGGVLGTGHEAQQLGIGFGIAAHQDVEIADDDRQHVVEIVGYAAGQPSDRLHLLALAQGRLGALALLHFFTQAPVAQGQSPGIERHDRQHQRRHDDQQPGRGVAGDARPQGIAAFTQENRAQPHALLGHGRRDGNGGGKADGFRLLGARRHIDGAVVRHQFAVGVVDRHGLDVGIGAQGRNVLMDRRQVVEGQGGRNGVGQDMRLYGGRLAHLGIVVGLGVDGQQKTGDEQHGQAEDDGQGTIAFNEFQ